MKKNNVVEIRYWISWVLLGVILGLFLSSISSYFYTNLSQRLIAVGLFILGYLLNGKTLPKKIDDWIIKSIKKTEKK